MDYEYFGLKFETVPGAVAVRRAVVNIEELHDVCKAEYEDGGLLHAVWGSDERDREGGFLLHIVLQDKMGLVLLEVPLNTAQPNFPNLADIFPAAGRMQRAIYDLLGVRAQGSDTRSWLRHESWPTDYFPLRRDSVDRKILTTQEENYPFVRVTGDGVHEIAVGPVHAGIIEPGHFRFSVVGEKVLRLEERLGYTHKGIEKCFETQRAMEGQRLAARISGDSAVAFSWAYCMALEGLCNVTPPLRAQWLRALCLERERIANHLGDLGALGNDAGFAVGLAQFSRLKENLLRDNQRAFGVRYLLDALTPGGMRLDLDEFNRCALLEAIPALVKEINTLREIYDDHAGLQDRFVGTGRVQPALARQLGLIGLAGRASGQAWDVRCDHAHIPYDTLAVRMTGRLQGDVAARVAVRFEEILESLRLCQILLGNLPEGGVHLAIPTVPANRLGIGWVEGWRGPVLVALETATDGGIRHCHAHDPSWQNWPVLEHAVIGNIVPDFPLINKSFNLSYSGQDL